MLDPNFPKRLTRSEYQRTFEFVQIFEEYARAGVTKRSDKEIAISGLLQRMHRVLCSEYVYGTFRCFLSRLLLWRVLDITEDGIACSGEAGHRLPSWSWMSHDHIEFPQFFPGGEIGIPLNTIGFDSEGQLRKLHVRLFVLRDWGKEKEEQGERHLLLRDNAQEIGQFWFDTHEKPQIKHCVVVGKFKENIWFVLLVVDRGEKRYKRFGIRRIQPRYISETSFAGILA
jgi:hypothetical protein